MEEACGVFGIYAPGKDVARMTGFGLQALQHRGQESAGIAVGDGETVNVSKDLGLVTQVFDERASGCPRRVTSRSAMCVIPRSGSKASWEAAQPHMSAMGEVLLALAHNGTLTNTNKLRARLIADGARLYSSTDSEVAAKLIGMYTERTNHLREGIRYAMELMEGAYAMVLCTADGLYAFRDPHGIRPLCIGELPGQCRLGHLVGDLRPGHCGRAPTYAMSNRARLCASTTKVCARLRPSSPPGAASCIFEYVYFARPDSVIDGQSVYQARRDTGRILARENPVEADLVLGVPDSGVPAALGYAAESGIEYTDGIVKNRYVGRTFIQPTEEMRQLGIRIKLNPLSDVIAGKRLVVIDDSIVRGSTSRKLVAMLRDAGAAEVHLRITSPEVLWPCFYGIDTATREQLIAANMDLAQMNEWIGSDSLAFLSLDGLREAVSSACHPSFCEACFTGEYPV